MTLESTRHTPSAADQSADPMEDIRRTAQQLLGGVSGQPLTVRIRASDIEVELDWTTTGHTVSSERRPAPTADEVATTVGDALGVEIIEGLIDVCAPTVGTFYRAPEPGAAPFVVEGDRVRAGQQIGIVEAMKLMIPLEAEHDGQVAAVLMEDGCPVEYGDRLFALTPLCTE